jgi:hypothetical protein
MTLTTSGRTLPNYIGITWTLTGTDPYPLEGVKPLLSGKDRDLKFCMVRKISLEIQYYGHGSGQELWQGNGASLGVVMH